MVLLHALEHGAAPVGPTQDGDLVADIRSDQKSLANVVEALTGCVPIARAATIGTVLGMSHPSDLTDDQWALLEPVFKAPGKRGRKHAEDLRTVVDAMLHIARTGCQWRYLPVSFGPWTRIWSQFRRWSRNGTWAQALTVLHAAARQEDGRTEETPSMVVITPTFPRRLERWSFHDRGGHYGRTKGAKRVVAVDVTGLPVATLVVPASTPENRASELILEHLSGPSHREPDSGRRTCPPRYARRCR